MCFHSSIHTLNTPLLPIIYRLRCCFNFQALINKSCNQASLMKKKCSQNLKINSIKSSQFPAPSIIDSENASDFWRWYEQKLGFDSYEREVSTKGDEDGCSKFEETDIGKARKERERRRKIGLANKGRVPWNKGKKHTLETRERISERTKEALMDPKVKGKIKECRGAHSEQTKQRISTSLRKLWAEKLKYKRSRANFLSIWTQNIAEAAKRGGNDQQELNWNSYDKIREEIAIEKEKEKIAEVQRKMERVIRLARKRNKHDEQRGNSGGEIKRRARRKSKEEREEMIVVDGLKLKERLTKIHKRKISTDGQISGEGRRTWEKLDFEFIKTKHRSKEISLADQIQAAKTKKVELYTEKSPAFLVEKSEE